MELCDIYDESGTRTGQVIARDTLLPQGQYYLAVQVWIRNETGEYLVQKRAAHLRSGPGMGATTAGYVLAGEDSLSGAIREVEEELGLQLLPAQLRQFDHLKMDNLMQDLWMAEVLKGSSGVPVAGEDVSDWMWASKAKLRQMVRQGEFFAYSYFNTLPE